MTSPIALGEFERAVTQSSRPRPSQPFPSGPTKLSPRIWSPAQTANTTAPPSTARWSGRSAFSFVAANS